MINPSATARSIFHPDLETVEYFVKKAI
ncbi:hypothetical protein ALC56_08031 [Trachymyrmex septentrionalis]|uniref:Uncharacterized protein n=1 Tax=Trachymyrmex septentrionalis TaxID=34720 RepID=A0A195FCA4_9HYME|nr:hypothetical protein ALC56_08031 [Trachymyrmex septentrionalis]